MSPFFVSNYVHLYWPDWDEDMGYCGFFVYFFSFHDLVVPALLILLSAYISLKYSGEL